MSVAGELEILIQGSLISQLTGRSVPWVEVVGVFGVVGFVGVFGFVIFVGFVGVFGSCCAFDFVLVPPTVCLLPGLYMIVNT